METITQGLWLAASRGLIWYVSEQLQRNQNGKLRPNLEVVLYNFPYQSRLLGMKSFKSSSLIEDKVKPNFMRMRRVSKTRIIRQQQMMINNPFRQRDEQNILPSDLKSQLQHMDYLSSNHIQSMTFTTVGERRSASFTRHLQAMQNAAKKQEDKYEFFRGCTIWSQEGSQTEIMQEQQPMTFEQNDNISTKMNQYFFRMDTDHMHDSPLNFLLKEEQVDTVTFSSQNHIQPENPSEDFQAYFDV